MKVRESTYFLRIKAKESGTILFVSLTGDPFGHGSVGGFRASSVYLFEATCLLSSYYLSREIDLVTCRFLALLSCKPNGGNFGTNGK
jgi:hypothetical protein